MVAGTGLRRGIARLLARADVLVVAERIHELAGQQIEVAVPVEVLEVGHGVTERLIQPLPAGHQGRRGRVPGRRGRALVAQHVDHAVQGAVHPRAARIVAIVPPVVGPVLGRLDDVEGTIAVDVHVLPHVVADALALRLRADECGVRRRGKRQRDLPAGRQARLRHVRPLGVRPQHAGVRRRRRTASRSAASGPAAGRPRTPASRRRVQTGSRTATRRWRACLDTTPAGRCRRHDRRPRGLARPTTRRRGPRPGRGGCRRGVRAATPAPPHSRRPGRALRRRSTATSWRYCAPKHTLPRGRRKCTRRHAGARR